MLIKSATFSLLLLGLAFAAPKQTETFQSSPQDIDQLIVGGQKVRALPLLKIDWLI
jgi:hypothetical protein